MRLSIAMRSLAASEGASTAFMRSVNHDEVARSLYEGASTAFNMRSVNYDEVARSFYKGAHWL